MAKSSRLDREYRRLVTDMNVPTVIETPHTKLDLTHLTTRIVKQSNLILDLAHFTTKIARW